MNSRLSNFRLVWVDDFNPLRMYVSGNPPHSRIIRYEPVTQPGPSTYEACYLREDPMDLNIALAAYEQAITNNKNDPYAYYNRGILRQERLNDLAGAASDFNKAVSLDPFLELALQSRGDLGDRAGIDLGQYVLVSFSSFGKIQWVNYEKMHYISTVTTDLQSPMMQSVFKTHEMQLAS